MTKSIYLFASLALSSLCLALPARAQSGGGGIIVIPPNTPPIPTGAATNGLAKYEPAGDKVFHGACLRGTWDMGLLRQQADQFQATSGKRLALVTWFASLYENGGMTTWRNKYDVQLDAVRRLGAVSLVKFSTQDAAFDATRKSAPLQHIALGAYDAYFEEMAQTLRDFGGPVFLSINHEMNGNWYPFSEAYPNSGVKAADYVAAWRHIVKVFHKQGADNVAFVWSPNVPDVGPVGLLKYYPGDDMVDWVGASFYSGNPVENMELVYRNFAAKKPIFITEWATSVEKNRYYPNFPGEAAWVKNVLTSLAQKYPRVKAISWFQWDKYDGNHLLQRVPDQAQAYAAAIQNPRYIDNPATVLALAPVPNQPRLNLPPREVILKEAVATEVVKSEVVKPEIAPATPAPPARAPLKLQILPRN